MNKKKQSYSIRGKLVSAACMLMVAVIMVVSSTYAWFTLSTAPEVSGMSTAIGANGALEMALFTGGAINDGVVSSQDKTVRNTYWGNLVDLSDGYGLNQITLNPSKLNLGADGKTILGSPVGIPVYGADGRVSEVATNKTLTGLFDSVQGGFFASNTPVFGVRAVGAASGMTPRQLAFRDAKSQGANAMSAGKSTAANTLNSTGSKLANIAIKHATANPAGSDTYDQTDVAAIRAMINGLKGTQDTTGALQYIEKAYMQYIAAVATSGASGLDDTTALAVYSTVNTPGKTLAEIEALMSGVSLPGTITTGIAQLRISQAAVETANTKLTALETGASDSISWTDLKEALDPLADATAIKVNGIPASEIKARMSELVNSVASGQGLVISLATGAGVFADIADQCGDYSAAVTIDRVEYGGLVVERMQARMSTQSTVTPSYLSEVGSAVGALSAPSSGSNTARPFSEFYGYIIDMAFRTNAAESNLLLQTAATDRIYDDNSADAATMGGGSTMVFSSTDANFGPEQIKKLMSNLRVVFFTPDDSGTNTGTVLVYAKLDTEHATVSATGEVEANLYLYKAETVKKTDASGNYVNASNTVLYYKIGDKYYTPDKCDVTESSVTLKSGTDANADAVAVEDMVGLVDVTRETTLTGNDAVITAMTQNATVKVSAMVYLDGENLGNDAVSATAQQSLSGKMNLQFSSSANLVPMEYADLHAPTTQATTN